MAFEYTPDQQKIIDLRGSSILVSAAAGSGKTAVLVERIVRMVCDEKKPVDIDRLLVVTFTNAAAAEMRERVSKGIAEKLAQHPESAHIQRQATLIYNAQITTIDSFCLFLLKNHFNEIGLDPAFRIADEGEIKMLQQDVMKELLEDFYLKGEDSFLQCVEYFCPGGNESNLEEYILKLSAYAASFPWPEAWLEERKKDYDISTVEELSASACGTYYFAYVKKMLQGYVQQLKHLQALCEQPDGPYMYGELIERETEALERLLRCENLADLERFFPTVVWGRLPSKKDDSVDPIKREIAQDLRAKIKAGVDKMKDGVFQTGLTLFVRQGLACREVVSVLIDLVQEFNRRMQEKKQEKKILDFSDAEHFALDILYVNENGQMRPSPVAKEYRQHFVEVMTDEYQDSNMVQEYLLKAVSGEDEGIYNRFMVGDVKQCIYRFRLARPELFLEKYKTFAEEGLYRRIDLAMNFRSRKEVVQSVNDVFGAIMSEQVGGIPYDERAALYVGAKFPENTENAGNAEASKSRISSPYQTELLLVEKPLRDEEESEREREAQAVAHRIKELRKSLMVQDKESKSLRPIRYSDMVILLRSNKGWDEVFKRTLEAAGIPVYITSKTGYFSAPEVQDLLQTLRVLDNPTQDIPLFGMMKSLFGGFTEEEIAKIRSYKKHVPLYEAIQEFATQSEDATAPKAKAFLECIQAYRKQAFYLPVRDLLTRLVTDFDYLNYVTALPAGAKRRANVEMLFTKAGEFEKSSYSGLFSFVRYVEQLEKCEVDYGEADTLDENADVVRIMSIHKSKGLEFPVVFVSGLAKKINKKDMDQGMIADMDLGLAVDYADSKRRVKNKTFRRHAISKKMLDDSLAEELRLLYVAFTRAKEKLILTSVYKDAKEGAAYLSEAGAQTFTYADYMGAVSCMDWLQKVVGGTSICIRGLDGEDLAEYELGRQVDLGVRKLRLQDAGKEMDQEALEKLKARLAAPYAYQNLESLYTKTTVSELKIAAMADKDEAAYHTFEEKDFKAYVPSFRKEEESISGTVRGNAYHRVMELMDFDAVLPTEEEKTCIERIKCFLEAEKESMRLPAQYAEAVHPRTLYRFMNTELAKRMQRAMHEGMLHREQPFVLGLPANKLGEQFPADETVLIQGIIDVYFEEEDGLVLLDYKTDSVPELDDLWKRYETQLDYYKEALERITGKRVKERILYSFHLHEYENERNTK